MEEKQEEYWKYTVNRTVWKIPVRLALMLERGTSFVHGSSTIITTNISPSASSTLQKNFRPKQHNLFLSHAGEDKSFVQLLHEELKRRQHTPFLDEEPDSLPEGCDFPDTIRNGIDKSQVVIVVLSKSFVTKRWPMLELVTAWKRNCNNPRANTNSDENIIIPIFYKLRVDEINKENLVFLHEIWGHLNLNPQECAKALKHLRILNGIVKTQAHHKRDYTFAKEVVRRICSRVTPIKLWANDGIETRDQICEDLNTSYLKPKEGRNLMFFGMWGPSGSGKTTIAMALCRYFYQKYCGWVFLLDLSKKHDKVALASELYEEIQGQKLERAHDVEAVVKGKLVESIEDRSFFLVLDNPNLTEQGQQIVQFVLDILCQSKCKECILMITAREKKFLDSWLLERNNNEAIVEIVEVPYLDENAAAKILYKTACPDKTWATLSMDEQEAIQNVCTIALNKDHYSPYYTNVLGKSFSRSGKSLEPVISWPENLDLSDLSTLIREQFQSMTDSHLQLFSLDAVLYDVAIETTLEKLCRWLGIIYGCQSTTIKRKLIQIRENNLLDWESYSSDDDDDDDPEIDTDMKFIEFAMEQVLKNPEKWGWFFYHGIREIEETGMGHNNGSNQYAPPTPKNVKNIEKIALVGGMFEDVGEVLNLTRYSKAIAFILSRCPKVQYLDVQWNKNIRVLELDKCASLKEIEGLQDLTQLVCLAIVDCPNLATICGNDGFQTLRRLEKLTVSRTAMKEAPNLQGCSKLQELILSENPSLQCLPKGWSEFPHLIRIDFSYNESITVLPDLSPLITSLRSLNISYCKELKEAECISLLVTKLELFRCEGCELLSSLATEDFDGESDGFFDGIDGDDGDDEDDDNDNWDDE